MDFYLGDKVSFLNEKLDGVVAKIVSKTQVEVTIEEGFDIPVLKNELVLVERVKKEDKSQEVAEQKKEPFKKKETVEGDNELFAREKTIKKEKDEVLDRRAIKKILQDKMQPKVVGKISLKHSHRRKDVEGEVDLHIEELLDSWKHMSNGEIVQHQLSVLRERLNEAILEGKHRIVFIHGVGNGTLKKEVRKVISSYPGIRYEEGHFSVYGAGATLVHL